MITENAIHRATMLQSSSPQSLYEVFAKDALDLETVILQLTVRFNCVAWAINFQQSTRTYDDDVVVDLFVVLAAVVVVIVLVLVVVAPAAAAAVSLLLLLLWNLPLLLLLLLLIESM